MTITSHWQQMPSSGRMFVRFWGGCFVLTGILVISLQVMGPPRLDGDDIDVASSNLNPGSRNVIPAPLPELQEKHRGPNGFPLPKKDAKGRTPRLAYASPTVEVPPGNAEVALVITGIGDARNLTNEAMASLPAPVTFAVSPYAPEMKKLLEQARLNNHETLLALPVQQDSKYDPSAGEDVTGSYALGPGLSPEENLQNYKWALSSLSGFIGVTNGFPGSGTESYTLSNAFSPILKDIDDRGLIYLNATPETTPRTNGPGGTVDVNINTDTDIIKIDIQLLKLQQAARRNHSAIGIIGPLRPVALACLRAWIPHLEDVGITLVPLSMLAKTPDIKATASDAGANTQDALPHKTIFHIDLNNHMQPADSAQSPQP
ncbi:divergent polysaccharide deacetylase family protein [Acetobacter thailandicus]|uniref:Divergent polysaccharide deacetylase family protein n=1 Tax=Acetobacter thailandicus TaxID=1502842 RepID=A0ABT3QFA4_9PROT|nr:divergent polysaccharide deacetylase family protein [Acetobacter thailandicus]MBS0960107.1 divergent polysaccharide deacetylase family protein [Acetobacter thailandicus]MBS0985641.1 divergent polysaccharide deacetylase family protein [Acetobacter thailandicus]MCX2563971.1 divergent polysaccharide deacetylase family protein [Acetobacter thailandicus]NHN94959.1 divergent polysaccharide deacetylase family protein [Acetobacter thailandicus]